MKITTRKIELTAEQTETFLVRRRQIIIARCKICESEAKMLSPESAASVAGTTPRTIYRLIETNQVHFIENSHGQMLVCFESLSKSLSERSIE